VSPLLDYMGRMSESLFPTRWAKDRPPSLEKFTSDFADDPPSRQERMRPER